MNGPTFRRLRNATGLSQAGFAAALGYTSAAETRKRLVSAWERGKRGIPNRTALLAELVASLIVSQPTPSAPPDHG